MDSESLTYKTLKNSVYSFVGSFLFPIVLTIIVTPIVIRKLGVQDYGVFLLLNALASFFGLVDLGLGSAVTKYAAEYRTLKKMTQLREILGSVKSIYTLFGTIGLLVFVILGKWFLPIFKISAQSQPHIAVIFFLAGLLFFFNTQNYVYMVVPAALQRFDWVSKINMAQVFFLNLLTLGVVISGYKLKAIMLVNVIMVLAAGVAYRFACHRLLPEIKIRYIWVVEEIKKAYRFGILASISSLGSYALAFLDRMIIPVFAGPALLSYYSLPGNVAIKIPLVTNSLGAMIFPMASSLQAEGDKPRIANVYIRIFRNISILAAALAVSVSVFAYPILYYWVGKEFADKGWLILIILSATAYLTALYSSLNSFLMGLGKVKILVNYSFSMVGLNVLLLLWWVPKYGITGAAWAYLASLLPVGLMFVYTEAFLEIKSSLWRYLRLYAQIFLASVVYYVLAKFLLLPQVTGRLSLVIIGPLSVLLYLLIYYLLGFADKEDVAAFKAFFQKTLVRFKL